MSWFNPTAEEVAIAKYIIDTSWKKVYTPKVLKQLATRQYAVLEASDLDVLVRYVNIAIELGYRPVGSVTKTFTTALQAVEKV